MTAQKRKRARKPARKPAARCTHYSMCSNHFRQLGTRLERIEHLLSIDLAEFAKGLADHEDRLQELEEWRLMVKSNGG